MTRNVVVDATSQNSDENIVQMNSSDVGTDSSSKASEIIKHSPAKQINSINIGVILFVIVAIIAFAVGYKRQNDLSK